MHLLIDFKLHKLSQENNIGIGFTDLGNCKDCKA